MKKLAIYPGSFAPFHQGHADVIKKALMVFDQVIVVRGVSSKSHINEYSIEDVQRQIDSEFQGIKVFEFDGLLKDLVKEIGATAIVKGIRNGIDLEHERTQQYWNEDLGIGIPVVYFISDRNCLHISSSAIRELKKIRESKEGE